MTDMAPRRMDGFARPVGSPPTRPAAAPQFTPKPQPAPAPIQQPRAAQVQPVAAPAQSPRQSGGWKVAVQFIVGLLVIAAVAAIIVWLYLKYYSQ
ncbi:MAG: hypothetical protein NVSMB39_2880 [Candidatus Saccharimonadales bacterium]